MNAAMDYIEGHLADRIDMANLAGRACCSAYHFTRYFSFVADLPLREYIRNRRLTLAAVDLRAGGKVVDVALRYGYESPEAFSRAFKGFHGAMPSAARDPDTALKSCPKMVFSPPVKSGELTARVVQREDFAVFGVYTRVSTNMEKAFEQVPRFFKKCDEDLVPDEINALLGQFHDNHTISAIFGHTDSSYKYMLCNFLPPGLVVPDKFTVLRVPAATWAVFDVPGGDMQPMWQRVWAEWFAASGYEAARGPSFEMYYGLAGHGNVFGEIWIPVIPARKLTGKTSLDQV